MTHIKRFDEYVNEMARYSKSFSDRFKSFTNRINRFNWYKYAGNVITNKYLESKHCLILPFVEESENKLLPVLVWRDRGGSYHNGTRKYAVSYNEFIGNVEDTIGSIVDFGKVHLDNVLDILGREYEYDVKVVIDNISYNPDDDKMNDFISHAFDKYDLQLGKADTNPSVDKIVYKP